MGLRPLGWLRPVGRVGGPPVRHGITTNTFRLETRKLPTWLFVRRLSRISRSGSALGGVDRRPPTGSHKLSDMPVEPKTVYSHEDRTIIVL